MLNKIKAVMLGCAVGDALGVPVEFCARDFLDKHPVTDMVGYGTHNMPAGTWSDDTSMSLCALDSLSKGVVDYNDIMEKFGEWYYHDQFTATNVMFDVGNTCANAIELYFNKQYSPTECGISNIRANGNGSLMRIHPFVLYTYFNKIKNENFTDIISAASSLTHRHYISLDGCIIYAYILSELLRNPSYDAVFDGLSKANNNITNNSKKYYSRLLSRNITEVNRSDIKSSGYIVDSLEAAIWCLLTTNNYSDCVLKAVNLGGDTDTIAAIAGGLAGALYGFESIPKKWLDTLKKRKYIEDMCERTWSVWKN